MTEGDAVPVEVFFYGLFMDEALLREKGLNPLNRRPASVEGFALVIGERATLVRREGARAHGFVYTLTRGEVESLYSEESVRAYRPELLTARLADGGAEEVACFNLPAPPSAEERDPPYASKLRRLAGRLGLPADYVSSIR
ncbi:MAG TPA: gamma-glutamylcyclotransferase family protein [Pyrinomonadaceae bacterium]|nr:gamma-glutamylcyclotransferase family protein [Pyrinomonadaceae bacterium]